MGRERYKLDVSVFVILQGEDGRVLFIKRMPEADFGEDWSIPAGGLDPHETLAAAAAREAHEEVGVAIEESALSLVHTVHCNTNGTEWLGIFFLATNWNGEPTLMEPHKHTEMQWHSLENIPAGTRLYVRQALEKYREGSSFSAFRWES